MLLCLRRSSTFAPRGTRSLVTRRAAKEPADDAVVAAGAAQRRERLDSELAALGFDAARLRAYLDVPARYALPLVVATGYAPAESPEPPPSPRLDVTDLFFEDRFGARPASS